MRKYDDLTVLEVDNLIQRYVSDALDYSATHRTLDGVRCNAAARRVQAVYSELRRRGPDAQKRLLELRDHPNEAVRSWVVADAMEFAPEYATLVLESRVAAGGLDGMTAGITLKAWREGTLKPPSDRPYRSHPVPDPERWPAVSADVADVLTVVSNRLDAVSPELAETFRRAPLETRQRTAVEASEMAVAEVGLEVAEVGISDDVEDAQYALHFEKLPAHEQHEKMKALAARLDQKASLLRDDADSTKRAYAIRLHAEARAASALALALLGDSTVLDAVLAEVISAFDGPENVTVAIMEMLRA